MKVSYRGHEIDVHRSDSLGVGSLLYYSVFRESDGLECISDFTSGADTVRDYIDLLKERIDEELESGYPWACKNSKHPTDCTGDCPEELDWDDV